jgi:N-methylhydantoinase A
MSWHLGIDIGGTFTDVVAHDSSTGESRSAKVWSVKDDPLTTIGSALESLDLSANDVRVLTFGTTIVTNAIIQGQLGRVALLTTSGFGDVLEIARQNRHIVYDIATPPREPAPVPRDLRFEINARMSHDGSTLSPIGSKQVQEILNLVDANVDAVAVSLLHAYANGEHEEAVGEICRRQIEHVSLSHHVWPQLKEYERTLATVLNAGVMPIVASYVATLTSFLPKDLRLELFHSAGGMMTPETATALPLSLALSGPAAGVEAAREVATDVDAPLAISLDMGGTTTDVCLIVDGRPEVHEQAEVGPWKVNLPMLAVHSIGAGGGSLVSHSASGLQVGPSSAGADPGPACYGRGGTRPTLTDAAVILGYLQESHDVDTGVAIRKDAAEKAYEGMARQLDIPLTRVARGVVRVANANMARALRRITVDKGVDTRDCVLIAFGGAGPMYAAELARDVGVSSVIVPRDSSLLSAVGCLATAPSYTRQRTIRLAGNSWEDEAFQNACVAIAEEAKENLLRGRKGDAEVELTYLAFMRYMGQSYAIEIPCTPETTEDEFQELFWLRHEELYGYHTDEPWEVQSLRVRASMDPENLVVVQQNGREETLVATATVNCTYDGGAMDTPIYRRESLRLGHRLDGPLIVADETSTTVVPPECTIEVTEHGHLRIDLGEPS